MLASALKASFDESLKQALVISSPIPALASWHGIVGVYVAIAARYLDIVYVDFAALSVDIVYVDLAARYLANVYVAIAARYLANVYVAIAAQCVDTVYVAIAARCCCGTFGAESRLDTAARQTG